MLGPHTFQLIEERIHRGRLIHLFQPWLAMRTATGQTTSDSTTNSGLPPELRIV
jgi:hypothetical protein